MKRFLLVTASALLCGNAMAAGPQCTTEERDSWMPEDEFKQQAELLGYDPNTLNVSEGNCYTLTSLDAANEDAMDYFDPMTGQRIEQ
ncbi:MAG: PepSY domain-containing protein [Gammaproteobacteria bacterium]|nr:PepSY domain-containing protein [Gammaproteobacteria bacterium]